MAVKNKKAIGLHIPNDIAFSILFKLPLKSIKRFTSASKSWSLLFKKPIFMKEFRDNFISKLHSIDDDDRCLLLDRLQEDMFSNTLYVVSSERFRFEDRVKLEWPPPLRDYVNRCIEILGSSSVNGILCVHDLHKIVLWNPAIGGFKVIPPSIQPYDGIEIFSRPQGFGYDRIRDDYKVIRSVRYPTAFDVFGGEFCRKSRFWEWVYVPNNDSSFWEWDMPKKHDCFWLQSIVDRYDPFWEIYSLKSNSWRKLDGVDMPRPWPSRFEVNLNELCHWFGFETNIVSFDFTSEIFVETTLPTHIPTEETQSSEMTYTDVHEQLVVLNESLGYIANHDMTAYFHIWILGELGVKESWTKLFVIGPIIGAESHLRAGNKGNLFFNKADVELAWLDLSTQRIEEIDGQGMYSSMIFNYKKNLRPIRGMNM